MHRLAAGTNAILILSLARADLDKYIANMLDEATIEQMSSEERIKAMELLWRALARIQVTFSHPPGMGMSFANDSPKSIVEKRNSSR